MNMTREIEQKIRDGDHISDKELLVAVVHFRGLVHYLESLGDRWHLAKLEARRFKDVLEGYERARREKR